MVQYTDNRRPEVLRLVPAARRVLEVGCNRGAFGAALEERGIEVWGIEPDPEAARVAVDRLSKVLVGCFPDGGPEGATFDGVVFNDVLEHMPDPHRAVQAARGLLAPGGWIVASIPNVRHLRVVSELLLRGRWDYADSGILDHTHLRFFTRATIRELFEQTGLGIDILEPINLTSGKRRVLRFLGDTGRDLIAEQFAVVARLQH